MKAPTFLFLLGGHDLEMQEISAILNAHNQPYLDRNLAWGAALSHYSDVLEDQQYQGHTFVGVELAMDRPTPPNFIRIDHHNDLAHMPAAILQVAELMGIEPSYRQMLIAANDSGFIPAMEKIGAHPSEIQEIRAADRKAQGVSEADEELAAQSILEHSRIESGVTIIEAQCPHFTPITDRMYGKAERLLCYRSSKLTYYGVGAGYLGQHFAELVTYNIAYQGGGENGYFGLAEGKVPGKIEDWIAQILEVLEDV